MAVRADHSEVRQLGLGPFGRLRNGLLVVDLKEPLAVRTVGLRKVGIADLALEPAGRL